MKKSHFVYKIINKINGKEYIGVHTGELHDNYLGSGYLIKLAVKKYGKENFERTILKEFQSRKQANEYEAELLTLEYVTKFTNYNLLFGFGYDTELERKKKLVRLFKQQIKQQRLVEKPKENWHDQYLFRFQPNFLHIELYRDYVNTQSEKDKWGSVWRRLSLMIVDEVPRMCAIITDLFNDKQKHNECLGLVNGMFQRQFITVLAIDRVTLIEQRAEIMYGSNKRK